VAPQDTPCSPLIIIIIIIVITAILSDIP